MAEATIISMGLRTYVSSTDRPRDRLGRYLRQRYPRDGAKLLARDIGCTQKAAENALAGHWPNDRHLGGIVRRFGRDVVEALFGPDIDETVSRLDREVADLERQLHEKKARLAEARGAGAGDQGPDAAPARALTEHRTFQTSKRR